MVMSQKQALSRYQKGRSRVLYRMTAFLVILFIISGVVIFFSYRDSQNRQIRESVDTRLTTYNKNIADSYEFMNRLLRALTLASYPGVGNLETVNAFLEKQPTPVQSFLNGQLKTTVDAKMFGAEVGMAMIVPSSSQQQAVVVASSDEGLIYNWQAPDYLLQAIRDGEPYIYLPNGMPELGLGDETLVLLKMGESAGSDFPLTFVRVVSDHDQLAAINIFYDQQRKDAGIALGLIILVSMIVLSLLSYLGLAYLIRKRINKPIDELAAAAEEVVGGNLDVEIEVRKGEEFEGLKYAFNELLGTFNAALSGSVGEKKLLLKPKRSKSRVLYQMTAFLVILFILSGLAIFFSFSSVRNRQFNENVDNLIKDYASGVSVTYDNMMPLFFELGNKTLPPFDPEEPMRALIERRVNEFVQFYNDWMKKMIAEGVMEADRMMVLVMPSSFIPKAEVFMSSDESLLFNWEVPDYLLQAIADGELYVYLPDGMPELDMNDETLLVIKKIAENTAFDSAFIGVASIHDRVATINDFYNKQKKDSALLLALIMLISAIVLSLLSFFALGYLIRKRITQPVDELAAVAEEVMQGNLDVEIEIHKGEEFEGLKYAFKELLDTFRKILSKSSSDQ
jgi:methyl-accepting chemotaxis protein